MSQQLFTIELLQNIVQTVLRKVMTKEYLYDTVYIQKQFLHLSLFTD
jgi:hypothetical protein